MAENNPWQQTPWGRILGGLVLSQGLYYGLRQLVTAGWLAGMAGSSINVWATLYGLLLLQAIQAVGLLGAGLLVGAGFRQGALFGAVLGVWNGLLTVALQGNDLSETYVTMLGQPILHTFLGGVGGFLGSRIWKPLPALDLPTLPRAPQSPQRPKPLHMAMPLFTGPIRWGRMLAGSALAVGGTIYARVILELVLDASEGNLSITSHLQAQLVTWEVTALAMLFGSAVAGAGTGNCLKQGLCVGLLTAGVLIGFHMTFPHWSMNDIVLTAASAVSLGFAGAWFGSNLLPPIIRLRRYRGLGPESA
jgi:hypothetical protein